MLSLGEGGVAGIGETAAIATKQTLSQLYAVPSQVYVRCTFCSQSISRNANGDLQHLFRSHNAQQQSLPHLARLSVGMQLQQHRVKNVACPSCRKPLGRCAICLLNIGTLVDDNNTQSPIDSWFTWCQKCRHGGHLAHISEWFSTNTYCPVSDCNCHCNENY
jgi:hypothetical protein